MSDVDGQPDHPEQPSGEPVQRRPGGDPSPPPRPIQYGEQHAAVSSAPGGTGLLAAEIVSGVVWSMLSLLVVFWVCWLFGLDEWTWVPVALWVASGASIMWSGTDELIAKYMFGMRRPTMVEGQRLVPSWHAVARQVGLDPSSRTVWIQNAEGVTAAGAGARTVSVTGWAMYTLPPSHLEAVVAFDLVSHLRGGTWLSRLAQWYSLPARVVVLGVKRLLKLSRTIPAIGCTIVGFLIIAYIGLLLFALIFYDSLAVPALYLSPVALPLIFGGLAHWSERMADRAAADLGYGRKLLEVFYGWQEQHQEASRRLGLPQPDWLGGQPSVAERIRALENYIQRS